MIPARYQSQRFPGKPLAMLSGADGSGKSLIQRTWEAACASADDADVHVVTDDTRIADAARAFGADVLMTPADCRNGTERCAAALALLPHADMIVNLQGDSPLTPRGAIPALLDRLRDRPKACMSTPMFRARDDVRARLIADAAEGRVGGTCVLADAEGRALYFSKHLLPFGVERDKEIPIYLHLGVYAYRREALMAYPGLTMSSAERAEGLEQLRFLHAGMRVDAVEIDAPGAFWEVNNPEDVSIVEAALAAQGMS
nr:3-deoxy-manno-octulosonate cytidylyltransferase [Pacificimonas pallii]